MHLSERQDDALNRFARLNGLRYTLDELLQVMGRSRIERGLLLSPPLLNGTPLSNDDIIRLCEKSRGKLVPAITVEPTSRGVSSAINLAQENKHSVKAFKVRLGYVNATATSPVFDELYDYCEMARLPILFHTGDTALSNGDLMSSHPLTIDRLANKRDRLSIVLCHFGNPWFDDVAELIYKHPNVHTDISGLITGGKEYAKEYSDWLARKISEAIYYAGGAGKIIFGTDYPVTKHSDALALVRRLTIDTRDKLKILGGNAERLFRL